MCVRERDVVSDRGSVYVRERERERDVVSDRGSVYVRERQRV